ncbi:hypothetical protein EV363DRAFT_1392657 [Boletus edulis]|nr:hypothetical protein EV363DRAFT_1392657 [Boletus edulis]
MSFSLMDNSDIASEDGVGDSDDDKESDAEITCIGVTGSKRQQTGSHKFTNKATNKTDDYVERYAGQAAMAAHQIWMDIHHSVQDVPQDTFESAICKRLPRIIIKITSFFQWRPSIPNHHHVRAIHGSSSPSISLSPSTSVLMPNTPICDTVLSNNQPKPTKSTVPPIHLNNSDDKSNKSANQESDPCSNLLNNDINKTNSPLTSFLDTMGDDEVTESNTELVLETVNKLLEQAKKYKSFISIVYLNSLKQFINLNTKYQANPKIKWPMQKASCAIAASIGKGPYTACKICALYRYISRFRTLPPTNKGNHHAHPTLLNNERIASAVRWYLTVLANGEITPLHLMKQVNEVIMPSLGLDLDGQNISEATARQWLAKLGYELKEVKKGIYVDGHEWEDVVTYRTTFLRQFGDNERLRCTYRDEDLEPIEPNLGPSERLHVPIMHDKTIIHANDLQHRVYVCDGKIPLRKKGQGRAIHVSNFIVEHTGRLTLSLAQVEENAQLPAAERLEVTDACKIIYPGKNHDGFWTNENLFVFDQSSVHGAFAKDALNAKEMNVKPGGKQRKMHDTTIPMDNPNPLLRGMPQVMVFPVNLPSEHADHAFCGQPKGMQQVLEERGLLSVLERANNGKVVGECQMCKLLHKAQERLAHEAAAEGADDVIVDTTGNGVRESMRMDYFMNEKPLIQIIIEGAGHVCWFLPKFHCKLNPIEMYWGWVKAHDGTDAAITGFRLVADGTFPTSWWYMDAYRMGLNAKQAEFAMKKYRFHCRCGPAVMMSVKVLLN